MKSGKVAVLLPVYNGERGIGPYMLRDSIQSILNQEYTDFRLIIINDGSTDNTDKIVAGYVGMDDRVEVINLTQNRGVAFALDAGIEKAADFKPDYICVQGSDDYSFPERLAIQVKFLDNNPDIGMAGCWYEARTHDWKYIGVFNDMPRTPERIFHRLINGQCYIGYPMVRWDIGQRVGWWDWRNFPERASDYDFFTKVGEVSQIAVVRQVLYALRRCSDDYRNSLSYDESNHRLAFEKAKQLGHERRIGKSCQTH